MFKDKKRFGKSLSLIEVFRFFEVQKQLQMQLLYKRYYKHFAYGLILTMSIFKKIGISLKIYYPSIRVLVASDKELEWKDLPVKELGENEEQREDFFNRYVLPNGCRSTSSIVQTNLKKVYIIGGE